MFSYLKGDRVIVDAGSITVMSATALHYQWSPQALTQARDFHSSQYFGFDGIPLDRLADIREVMAFKPHLLAKSQGDGMILVYKAPKLYTHEQEYLDALKERVLYPSISGSTPIVGLSEMIKHILHFSAGK